MLTRRRAIWTGGAALILAGCGGRPARTVAGEAADLPILGAALEVERAQVALHETGLKLVRGDEADLVRAILEHEREHVRIVSELIRELGDRPAPARERSEYTRGFPFTARAWRRYAIRSEQEWSDGYADVIPKLLNDRLRGTFGALMTTEAEHAVALGIAWR